jgi:hypothetical protein
VSWKPCIAACDFRARTAKTNIMSAPTTLTRAMWPQIEKQLQAVSDSQSLLRPAEHARPDVQQRAEHVCKQRSHDRRQHMTLCTEVAAVHHKIRQAMHSCVVHGDMSVKQEHKDLGLMMPSVRAPHTPDHSVDDDGMCPTLTDQNNSIAASAYAECCASQTRTRTRWRQVDQHGMVEQSST